MENKSSGCLGSSRDASIHFYMLLGALGPSLCFSTQNGATCINPKAQMFLCSLGTGIAPLSLCCVALDMSHVGAN